MMLAGLTWADEIFDTSCSILYGRAKGGFFGRSVLEYVNDCRKDESYFQEDQNHLFGIERALLSSYLSYIFFQFSVCIRQELKFVDYEIFHCCTIRCVRIVCSVILFSTSVMPYRIKPIH